MYPRDTREWAESVFGTCDLGDVRRLERLIDYASRQALQPKATTSRACGEDTAALEGAQRLLRNPDVDPHDIDEGVFERSLQGCAGRERILAIQDTTTIKVRHRPLAQDRIKDNSAGGWFVHTALAVDGKTGEPLGVIDQERWLRPKNRPGTASRGTRPYQEKESYKWELSLRRVRQRLPATERLVTVGDRESDIYEFLYFMTTEGLRFVVRGRQERRVDYHGGTLADGKDQAPVFGHQTVWIGQRGACPQRAGTMRPARKKREAHVELRAQRATFRPPKNRHTAAREPVTVNVVWVVETHVPRGAEALEWMLLTSEPIETDEDVARVVKDYEHRWIIEEYHQAWKTGCAIEARALQSDENLDRIYAITSPIAVRLLQLKHIQNDQPDQSCQSMLSEDEWQCLYASVERG